MSLSPPTVLGMDLSLAGTAVATAERSWRLKTKGQRGDGYDERLARIRLVRTWAIQQMLDTAPALVVLEGPAPGGTQRLSSWDRAPVWWAVLEAADDARIPVAVVPPTSVKKYATDNGRCSKSEMIGAAFDRGIGRPADDNEADALWLMAMGRSWLGHPLATLPMTQARAINGAVWPDRSLVRAA